MQVKALIGQRIKELRRASGMSQEVLAEKMGISSKYLSSIERGKENPTLDTFISLAAALGVELRDLFNFSYHGKSQKELKELVNSLIDKGGEEKMRLIVKLIKAIYL
ncbi:MAG: helix-turn-helix transcriptional regulator [Deltaproteobacteria bacterium]|nr:helix-turn-helix transcriptional regulator [Deltaproteobacteria bacterium]